MPGDSETSRTFNLDEAIVYGLCSPDTQARDEAILELPESLTRAELADIGIQVNLAPGASAIFMGRKLERDALFHIGSTALYRRHDLVTAENAARELKRRGITGIGGYLILKNEVKKVKKNIIDRIVDER